jgi:NADH dehydrogenase
VIAAAHGALGRGENRSEAVDDAGHRSLIDAARSTGVTRFVYTSALGAAPDHPVDFFRTKWAIEQYLASSGIAHATLRPTAFMEWHAHAFNGKQILDRGRTVILGTGTKLRNFVAAGDVAAVATQLLTSHDAGSPTIAVAGPGNFTNDDVARLYARIAGVPARIVHVPRAAVAAIACIARPLHPGVARAMRLGSLRDDAFPEAFDPRACAVEYAIGATALEDFVRERVAEHRAAASG